MVFIGETYLCWAYAISSMLRQSLKVFVNSLDRSSRINENVKQAAIKLLSSGKFHRRLRSELVMMPIPKPLTDDAQKVDESYLKSQSHNVESAINRVSYKTFRWPLTNSLLFRFIAHFKRIF